MKSREKLERQSWGGERPLKRRRNLGKSPVESRSISSRSWPDPLSGLETSTSLSCQGLLSVGVRLHSFTVPLPSQTIAENSVDAMPGAGGVPCLAVLPALCC